MITPKESEAIAINVRTRRIDVVMDGAGAKTVTHGLNMQPKSIIVVLKDASANVWFTDLTGTTLSVNTNAAVSITLEVK